MAVLAMALVLAAGANAELLVGEGTSPELSSISPEADILAGKAEYDTVSGKARFTVTTAAVPLAEVGGVPSKYGLSAGLVDTTAGCDLASDELGDLTFPYLQLAALYRNPSGTASLFMKSGEVVALEGSVSKSVTGATTTLEFASSKTAGRGYDCAALATQSEALPPAPPKYVFFPIAVPPLPPPAEPISPVSQGSTSPTPAAPGAPILSIASRKPLKLKVGKWKKVKLTVTNTGTAGTNTGSLRAKAPKGVSVKPKKQRLPALAPGRSWTVSVRVRLTAKAKKKSTLSLTAAAAGAARAGGSFVVKLRKQSAANASR